MADGFVVVRDSTGVERKIDNTIITRDSENFYRQEIVLATATDETKFDYDGRTDSNPVYVGKHTQGASTADADWIIQKFTYDSSDRVTRIETLQGAWDNRASLSWGA